jgi:hypothetical protein
MPTPTFGDHVRVIDTHETQAVSLAGVHGTVSGFTTPSVTGVEVIGRPNDDYAVAVMIEARNDETYWFAEDLLEFLDHAPGTEVWVSGAPFKEIRNADGSWRRAPISRKPWWKFW